MKTDPAARTRRGLTRRGFLRRSLAGGAGLMAGGTAAAWIPRAARQAPGRRLVTEEPWGRLEKVGEGVWVLTSTPLSGDRDAGAFRTFSNGGIVAGRDAVLAIEGFASIEGAAWLAGRARELTGKEPTHVVLTHVHGDHTSGTAGYQRGGEPLEVIATDVTRRLLLERELEGTGRDGRRRRLLLPDRVIPADGPPLDLDLGDRRVRIVPRAGHTPSDLTVELQDPRVVWCGDLVWNGFFPNYVDAIPSRLSRHCRDLIRDPRALYVPGHGRSSDATGLSDYLALLDHVEAAARSALDQGVPASEVAESYRPPGSLAEWTLFSPRYYRVALEAWERELLGVTSTGNG